MIGKDQTRFTTRWFCDRICGENALTLIEFGSTRNSINVTGILIDAENAFNGTGATCLTFISSNRRIPALFCQSQKPVDAQVVRDLIEREPSVLDLYIFPPNFEWTVVFTHEDTWNCIFARGDDDL